MLMALAATAMHANINNFPADILRQSWQRHHRTEAPQHQVGAATSKRATDARNNQSFPFDRRDNGEFGQSTERKHVHRPKFTKPIKDKNEGKNVSLELFVYVEVRGISFS